VKQWPLYCKAIWDKLVTVIRHENWMRETAYPDATQAATDAAAVRGWLADCVKETFDPSTGISALLDQVQGLVDGFRLFRRELPAAAAGSSAGKEKKQGEQSPSEDLEVDSKPSTEQFNDAEGESLSYHSDQGQISELEYES